jgi:hypothetical protein
MCNVLIKVEMTKMMLLVWFLFHIFDGKCVGEIVGRMLLWSNKEINGRNVDGVWHNGHGTKF